MSKNVGIIIGLAILGCVIYGVYISNLQPAESIILSGQVWTKFYPPLDARTKTLGDNGYLVFALQTTNKLYYLTSDGELVDAGGRWTEVVVSPATLTGTRHFKRGLDGEIYWLFETEELVFGG